MDLDKSVTFQYPSPSLDISGNVVRTAIPGAGLHG